MTNTKKKAIKDAMKRLNIAEGKETYTAKELELISTDAKVRMYEVMGYLRGIV